MNIKLIINTAVKTVGSTINRNSPSILIALGVGGFFTTIGMAIEATGKAVDDINDYAIKETNDMGNWRSFPLKVRAEMVWPLYVPTASMALLSTAAIFLGNRIHLKRTAALASLYTLTEKTLKTYQEKVLENVGKTKAGHIHGDVVKDALNENPPTEENTYNIGGGIELCFEMSTGRYFYSDAEKIRAAINKFNKELMSENVKTLNELYFDLGLPSVELGNYVGWEVDNGLVEEIITAQVSHFNERPTLALDFINRPMVLFK